MKSVPIARHWLFDYSVLLYAVCALVASIMIPQRHAGCGVFGVFSFLIFTCEYEFVSSTCHTCAELQITSFVQTQIRGSCVATARAFIPSYQWYDDSYNQQPRDREFSGFCFLIMKMLFVQSLTKSGVMIITHFTTVFDYFLMVSGWACQVAELTA